MAPTLRSAALLLLGWCTAALAQDADSSFQRWAGLPIFAYTQETGAMAGLTSMIFFKPDDYQPYGDQIDIAAMHSQNHQTRFTALWKSFWLQSKIYGENKINYRDWPGRYYGTYQKRQEQPDRYDMFTVQVEGSWRYGLEHIFPWTEWLEPFSWGVEYDVEYNTAKFADPAVAEQLITGGMRVGLGMSLVRDTRDNNNYASRGTLFRWQQLFYPRQLGSTHQFVNTEAQFCYYLSLWGTSVLALGVYGQGTWGDVPFDRLAIPDGSYQMRGLEKGIWRDKQQLVWQSEVRVPLFWRLGGVVFAEAAQLGPYFSEMLRAPLQFDLGIGGRFALNVQRKLNARADLSWVNRRVGITIYYNEAF